MRDLAACVDNVLKNGACGSFQLLKKLVVKLARERKGTKRAISASTGALGRSEIADQANCIFRT
jgi:hypothetical protein